MNQIWQITWGSSFELEVVYKELGKLDIEPLRTSWVNKSETRIVKD